MSLLRIQRGATVELPGLVEKSAWARLRRRTFEVLERAEPGDALSLVVDVILVVLISMSVVAVILESIDSLYQEYTRVFYWFEILTVIVFTFEYLLRFWSSVECPLKQAEPRAAGYVRLRYMVSASAVIDLLAILPFYLTLGGLIGTGDARFLRVVRLLRVLKLTRYSAAFETLIRVFKDNARSFAAAFFVLIVVMLLAATGMYYFEHDAQPKAFSSILASMWWAFSTLTTVGYGDVTPITVVGKVFGAMITVVGVGMVALPTGILASAYTEQLRLRSDEYRVQSDLAYEDGVLSSAEAMELEELRQNLGLGKHTASQILNAEKVRASLRGAESAVNACPHCGGTLP